MDVRAVMMMPVSVAVLVRRGEQVLAVTNRKFGGYSLVGGKVHDDESITDAATRELREETGLEARALLFIGAHPSEVAGVTWVTFAFRAEVEGAEPREVEEGTRPFWTTEADLCEHGLWKEYDRWLFEQERADG